MSRGRFGLLLAVLVLVVGSASFAGVYALLGDEVSTPPGVDDTPTTTVAPSGSTTTATTAPGALATPTFVVVVSSESNEAGAQAIRDELTEGGYDSGVLHSDDYPSLAPGFWVAYVGPFPDGAAAEAAKATLVADGYTASYSRCVGTDAEC